MRYLYFQFIGIKPGVLEADKLFKNLFSRYLGRFLIAKKRIAFLKECYNSKLGEGIIKTSDPDFVRGVFALSEGKYIIRSVKVSGTIKTVKKYANDRLK